MKKKRLTWNASSSPDVAGYRLYWSKAGNADYDSEHAELGNVTQVVLPDDIASFPVSADRLELGITAVSPKGNESDMVRVTLRFEHANAEEARLIRLRPGTEGWEPPLNAPVLIDGLNHCVIRYVDSDGSLSPHTRYFYFESHYIEQWPVRNRILLELNMGAGKHECVGGPV
jgi:hypothetical protein